MGPRVYLSQSKAYKGALLAVTVFLGIIAVSTAGLMAIEGWTFIESLYMTLITVSTVGFREVRPLSALGQLFVSAVIVISVVTLFYGSTRLGQLILAGELRDVFGKRRMDRELQKLNNHYIVCGFGRLGRPVARGLAKARQPFCVVDNQTGQRRDIDQEEFPFLIGDATEEAVLEACGISRAKALLALLPSDADNLYLTLTAKAMNPNVKVIARVSESKAETKLLRVGADRVVSPYETAGATVLQTAIRPTVVDFLALAAQGDNLALNLEEIRIEDGSPLAGRSIIEAALRDRYGVMVIAIKRENGDMVFNPASSDRLYPRDTLVAVGEAASLAKLEKESIGPEEA